MDTIRNIIRPLIPKRIFRALQPVYHYILALWGALVYRFPSKKLVVIGVTGTKGKSSTTEYINSILEQDGHQTALVNTIRHKIGSYSKPNKFKMTMPGRLFLQHFLRQALNSGCTHAVIEMSSEGVIQYRHRFIDLDALIFTNLSPEHIESHGSYENYVAAKIEIAKRVTKKSGVLIVNKDDAEAPKFLALTIPHKITYSLKETRYEISDTGTKFSFQNRYISSPLKGVFNVYNMLAAATYASFAKIDGDTIKKGLEHVHTIKGRAQEIDEGQSFTAVVDYAHTEDSLRQIYEAYKDYKIIGVLGGTGGGRDRGKRKDMGHIAETYCDYVFITNEDPYDEDPWQIINDVALGITNKNKMKKIMSRREAIREALCMAETKTKEGEKVAVLITGKGTDPYIMEAKGKKTPWSDESVVREELKNIA